MQACPICYTRIEPSRIEDVTPKFTAVTYAASCDKCGFTVTGPTAAIFSVLYIPEEVCVVSAPVQTNLSSMYDGFTGLNDRNSGDNFGNS